MTELSAGAKSKEVNGAMDLGDGLQTTITMPKWHWGIIQFLARDLAIDVADEIIELRALYPDEALDQIVYWYVETTYDKLMELPENKNE